MKSYIICGTPRTGSTLLCGDLFSQPGGSVAPLTSSAEAVWEPSEAMRAGFPYAPLRDPAGALERLAARRPRLLACMHGSSYEGDGGALLGRLGRALATPA